MKTELFCHFYREHYREIKNKMSVSRLLRLQLEKYQYLNFVTTCFMQGSVQPESGMLHRSCGAGCLPGQ